MTQSISVDGAKSIDIACVEAKGDASKQEYHRFTEPPKEPPSKKFPVQEEDEEPDGTEERFQVIDGKITIELEFPVKGFSKIILRRPKAKHVKNFKFQSDGSFAIGDILTVACAVSGTSKALMDEVEWPDVTKITEAMLHFLE